MVGSAATGLRERRPRACLAAGRYVAHDIEGADELEACLALRRLVFRKGQADDRDRFDSAARHVLLTDRCDGSAVACFRYRIHSANDLSGGYTAQFYDLAALASRNVLVADLGRVTVAPGRGDPDLLRLLLAALTRMTVAEKVRVVFGCSSLPGADIARHAPTLAWLRAHHAASLAVSARCAARCPEGVSQDGRDVPPLLRSYLAMGARVAPDPVADPALDTLHVFTMLELDKVPIARARSLIRLMRMAEQAAG